MPELPEVERFRKYIDSTSLKKTILRTRVIQPSILDQTTPSVLGKCLKNNCFMRTFRIGKHLLIQAESNCWINLHFGMTGFLRYEYKKRKNTSHPCVIFYFNNNYKLIFDCTRRLGEIGISKNLEDFRDKKNLGPDALEISYNQFRQKMTGHKGAIKSLLMNQRVIAGIGNMYSDEILFMLGIRPDSSAAKLNHNSIEKIYTAMRRILNLAIDVNAHIDRMPEQWLIHRRKSGLKCSCGGKIERKIISGRSSYFCPECQNLL